MNKYRIKTDLNLNDKEIKVSLDRSFDTLNILSLEIETENLYKHKSSDYGIIVGRVNANNGFGVPNAKLSIFIPIDQYDTNTMKSIYPYKEPTDPNYSLLPKDKEFICHNVVGNLYNKREVIDNDVLVEVFDSYLKFTTKTNNSGDYMIFGVPVGGHIMHMDVDLSDIGVLSQRPIDMIYKGYNPNMFDSPNKFKSSSSGLDLPQIVKSNLSVSVKPLWGDEEFNEIGITRQDFNLNYSFEPTCIFMGSLISDKEENSINKDCSCKKNTGNINDMVTSTGTIEMIRKTLNKEIEVFNIKGAKLIDSNGVWCYQIPMNLDYMVTDEYGDLIPSDDPTKGIPIRTRVRFRAEFSLTDENDEHPSKRGAVLIPNNPNNTNNKIDPKWFEFSQETKDEDFRDLLWNKVYTVKQHIPRIQKSDIKSKKNFHYRKFLGIKSSNISEVNNPFPYNKATIVKRSNFRIICSITIFIIKFVKIFNKITIFGRRFWDCIELSGLCENQDGGDYVFLPGCSGHEWTKATKGYQCTNSEGRSGKGKGPARLTGCNGGVIITRDLNEAIQCTESQLSEEYNIVNMDFYNDWINGVIYLPYFNIRNKKRSKSSLFCNVSGHRGIKKQGLINTCAIKQNISNITHIDGCNSNGDCHKLNSIIEIGGFGFIYKDEKKYYYIPKIKQDKSDKLINIFATDIVLLGSLVDCDIHKIPKIKTNIIPTTYKMPPFRPELDNPDSDIRYGEIVESGVDMIGNINRGLFYDLKCGESKSYHKTCVNAMRICEIGVSTDETFYETNSRTEGGFSMVKPDGYINKEELSDFDFKTIFATLNSNPLLVCKDYDGYNINQKNIKRITNFDGLLNGLDVIDLKNNDYINFRYGVEDTNLASYYDENNRFPIFNNSFYFYFGLNKGNTAIEKLYSDYIGQCEDDPKTEFGVNIKINNFSPCNRFGGFDVELMGGSYPYEINVYDVQSITPIETYIINDGDEKIFRFTKELESNVFNYNYKITIKSQDDIITKYAFVTKSNGISFTLNSEMSFYGSGAIFENDKVNDIINEFIKEPNFNKVEEQTTLVLTSNISNELLKTNIDNLGRLEITNIIDPSYGNTYNLSLMVLYNGEVHELTSNDINITNITNIVIEKLPPLKNDEFYFLIIKEINCDENYFSGINKGDTDVYEYGKYKCKKILSSFYEPITMMIRNDENGEWVELKVDESTKTIGGGEIADTDMEVLKTDFKEGDYDDGGICNKDHDDEGKLKNEYTLCEGFLLYKNNSLKFSKNYIEGGSTINFLQDTLIKNIHVSYNFTFSVSDCEDSELSSKRYTLEMEGDRPDFWYDKDISLTTMQGYVIFEVYNADTYKEKQANALIGSYGGSEDTHVIQYGLNKPTGNVGDHTIAIIEDTEGFNIKVESSEIKNFLIKVIFKITHSVRSKYQYTKINSYKYIKDIKYYNTSYLLSTQSNSEFNYQIITEGKEFEEKEIPAKLHYKENTKVLCVEFNGEIEQNPFKVDNINGSYFGLKATGGSGNLNCFIRSLYLENETYQNFTNKLLPEEYYSLCVLDEVSGFIKKYNIKTKSYNCPVPHIDINYHSYNFEHSIMYNNTNSVFKSIENIHNACVENKFEYPQIQNNFDLTSFRLSEKFKKCKFRIYVFSNYDNDNEIINDKVLYEKFDSNGNLIINDLVNYVDSYYNNISTRKEIIYYPERLKYGIFRQNIYFYYSDQTLETPKWVYLDKYEYTQDMTYITNLKSNLIVRYNEGYDKKYRINSKELNISIFTVGGKPPYVYHVYYITDENYAINKWVKTIYSQDGREKITIDAVFGGIYYILCYDSNNVLCLSNSIYVQGLDDKIELNIVNESSSINFKNKYVIDISGKIKKSKYVNCVLTAPIQDEEGNQINYLTYCDVMLKEMDENNNIKNELIVDELFINNNVDGTDFNLQTVAENFVSLNKYLDNLSISFHDILGFKTTCLLKMMYFDYDYYITINKQPYFIKEEIDDWGVHCKGYFEVKIYSKYGEVTQNVNFDKFKGVKIPKTSSIYEQTTIYKKLTNNRCSGDLFQQINNNFNVDSETEIKYDELTKKWYVLGFGYNRTDMVDCTIITGSEIITTIHRKGNITIDDGGIISLNNSFIV